MKLYDRLNDRFEAWVVARHRPQAGAITIRRGRCYILPTRPGLVFAAMLLVMLLGAMNYSNNLAFGLTFLLGGMGLVGMHHTNANLLGLTVTLGRIQPAFAGEPLWLPVHLINHGAKARYSIQAGLKRVELSSDTAVDCPDGSDATTGFSIPTQARGVYPVPRFAVATDFPLGLFRAWSWLSFARSYLVYPAPAPESRPIPPQPGSRGERRGQQAGREDFSGLRDYRPGDALRTLNWKSYAHSGELTVKTFSDPLDETQWLDWSSLGDIGDPEARLSQLCRWILDCEAGHEPYGLRLPEITIEPARGIAHRERCLEALARHPGGRRAGAA